MFELPLEPVAAAGRPRYRQASTAPAAHLAELGKLAKHIDIADPVKALNEVQTEASHTQLDMLHADIPTGRDPHLVREWWDGLSPQEQKTLMLAEPVALASLNGVPDGVKQELRGTDGKLDRVKLVRRQRSPLQDRVLSR